jgi:hypothetical protein
LNLKAGIELPAKMDYNKPTTLAERNEAVNDIAGIAGITRNAKAANGSFKGSRRSAHLKFWELRQCSLSSPAPACRGR